MSVTKEEMIPMSPPSQKPKITDQQDPQMEFDVMEDVLSNM